jgi:ATP-binding protein involved in chromosome partitioning
MAGYACPHCGEMSDPFGSGGAESTAAELGVAFLGRLPLSLALRQNSDAGTPLVEGPEAEAFATLADKLLDALKQEDVNAAQ